MAPAWLLLAALGWTTAADPDGPATLRYLRPENGRFVLESEVTTTPTRDGSVTVSLTDRGQEKLTLTVRWDRNDRLTSAEVVHETAKNRKTIQLILNGTAARLKRDGITDFFEVEPEPIVTSAPDWSDIFQLVRRYDLTRGGKQEFPGLWIHPTRPMQKLTFAIERVGSESIQINDQKKALDRYRIKLRSGDYHVWADASRRVIKLLPSGAGAKEVVLEGFEEAARELRP